MNTDNQQKKKSKWGIGIAALYGGFVVFIVSVVIFAASQDFTMVEDNYYQKSLSYQTQIDQLQNTNNLAEKPKITFDKDNQTITINFPDSLAQLGISGTVHFFRPSDKRVDQIIPIELTDNRMVIESSRFLKGSWVLKLSWESSGTSYYQKESLTL